MTMIIDCHGHYTVLPKAHDEWREAQKAAFKAGSECPPYPAISDDEIRETIRRDHRRLGQTWCPHTATAACVYERLGARRAGERWVLVATAHPAKFNDVVEPLIGEAVPVPPALAALLDLPSVQTEIGPNLDELRGVIA